MRGHLRSLDRLLDDERAAILAGRLNDLDALIDRKERLIGGVRGDSAASGDAIRALRAKAERNGELLDAALSGVRSAVESLRTLRDGGPALATYDTHGARSVHAANQRSLNRRA